MHTRTSPIVAGACWLLLTACSSTPPPGTAGTMEPTPDLKPGPDLKPADSTCWAAIQCQSHCDTGQTDCVLACTAKVNDGQHPQALAAYQNVIACTHDTCGPRFDIDVACNSNHPDRSIDCPACLEQIKDKSRCASEIKDCQDAN